MAATPCLGSLTKMAAGRQLPNCSRSLTASGTGWRGSRRVNDKRRTLALLEAGRIRHTSLTSEIEQMTRHGDVVVVMGSDRVTGPPHGTITHRRFTDLWRLEGGAWRCFARQANAFKREPAPRREEAGAAA
jgi:ketosteroid isomerase-like protein